MCKQAYFGLILSAIASVLVVPSCSFEEQETNTCDEEYSFVAEQLDTRAYVDVNAFDSGTFTFNWETGDKIGAYGYYTNNAQFTTSVTATTAVFSGRVVSGDRMRYAYFPYTPLASSYRSIPVNVASNQYFDGVEALAENVIRASNRATTTRSGKVTFTFSTLVSLMKFNIDLSALSGFAADEAITGIKVVDESEHNFVGDYTLNLTNLSLTASSATNELHVDIPASPYVSDGLYTAAAVVAPGIRSGDRLGITIETEYHTVYTYVTCDRNYSAGQLYTINCVLTPSSPGLEVGARTFDPIDFVDGYHGDWVDGNPVVMGGTDFSLEYDSYLTDIGITEDQTINDSSLENAIVFVDEGVTLTLGPDATIGNTLILCNDEGGKANLAGSIVASSASGSFVGFRDMNISSSIEGGAGLSSISLDNCDVTVPSTGGSLLTTTRPTFSIFYLANNVIHGASATNGTYSLVSAPSSFVIDNVAIFDNMFLNVAGSSSLIASSEIYYLTLEKNHFNYTGALADDFAIFTSDSILETPEVSSNSFYAPSGAGAVAAYTSGSTTVPAGKATTNPLTYVDVAAGEYTIGQYLAAATYDFDGANKNCDVTVANRNYSIKHAQDPDIQFYAMPGVTITESGSLASTLTVNCSYNSASQSYSFTLPDKVSSSSVQSLSSLSGTWVTQWADEFNSSDWDREVWTRCPQDTPDWAKAQWPDDETLVTVEDGALIAHAKKDSDTSKGREGYITGGIWGKGLKSFNLGNGVAGRIDVRAKMTSAQGYWPAIWMMPDQQGFAWPQWGEIDIMEHLNHESKYYTTLHRSEDDGGDHKCSATQNYSSVLTAYASGEWHVYSVIVADNAIYTLFDGEVVLTCNRSDHGVTDDSSIDTKMNYWPFASTNYYMILDSQLGGDWVGSILNTALPAKLYIDYVRYMVRQ